MAGPTFIVPVDVSTETTGSYVDIDVSSYVSATATAAILKIRNAANAHRGVYARQNGSTDDRYIAGQNINNHGTNNSVHTIIVGLDASKIFEIKLEANTTNFEICGYFEGECVWITNATDKSTDTTDSYVDIDISADTGAATATAAIIEPYYTSGTGVLNVALRQNGATTSVGIYNIVSSVYYRGYRTLLVGVDGSEIFEVLISTTVTDLYLRGYLTDGIEWNTNKIDRSTTTTAAYEDVAAPNAAAIGVYAQFYNSHLTASGHFAGRKNGDTYDSLNRAHPIGTYTIMTGCDESGVWEQYITATTVDCFEIAWFSVTPEPEGGRRRTMCSMS